MYCVNKFNRIVEVEDEFGQSQINKGLFREATQKEVDDWTLNRQAKSVPVNDSSIYFVTVNKRSDGYGMSQFHLRQSLLKQQLHLTEYYRGQKVSLLYGFPTGVAALKTPFRIIYTMFESDKIPDEWVDYLKVADEVIVPSTFCADAFKKAGIETTVVPLGYNSDVFTYHERRIPVVHGEVFTFIHYDSFNIRKGFAEVFKAFTQEFTKEEPVKLILKTTREHVPFPILHSQYPNIRVIQQDMHENELFDLLKTAHCMVYPSKGEGFGITPLEAMATGIPAIVPNAHGISEYFDKRFMLEVKTRKTKAVYRKFKGQDLGNMVVANIKDLRKQMRYAYNNQQEMAALGKKASEHVKDYTYTHTAIKLKHVLMKYEKKRSKRRKDKEFLSVEVL